MTQLFLADIEIDSQVTPQKAEITFRLRESAWAKLGLGDSLVWSGRVRGPFCAFSQTLAANYPLRASKTGGEAITTIPDFCHWSAELPFTYELDFELKSGDQSVAKLRETIAVHWIRLYQGKFYQAAKRWVPRLTRLKIVEQDELKAWLVALRLQELALVVSAADASDALLLECQTLGIPIAIEMATNSTDDVARWESFACVFLVMQAREAAGPIRTRLFVASHDEDFASLSAARWSVRRGDMDSQQAPSGQLVVREGVHTSPVEARAACDQLQADTAQLGDWAAYLA